METGLLMTAISALFGFIGFLVKKNLEQEKSRDKWQKKRDFFLVKEIKKEHEENRENINRQEQRHREARKMDNNAYLGAIKELTSEIRDTFTIIRSDNKELHNKRDSHIEKLKKIADDDVDILKNNEKEIKSVTKSTNHIVSNQMKDIHLIKNYLAKLSSKKKELSPQFA